MEAWWWRTVMLAGDKMARGRAEGSPARRRGDKLGRGGLVCKTTSAETCRPCNKEVDMSDSDDDDDDDDNDDEEEEDLDSLEDSAQMIEM
ncbi:hypothetical protein Sjap_024215 [Stephania japonica]|uniref:Uncharacterized protein n=1 Tax=Stephania japonica TaxID=461633 RepID=A0AAP0EIB4_9MAGN